MLDLQNCQLFQSLPGYVKENILQCGIDFQDEQHLRAYVSNLQQEFQQLSSQLQDPTAK